MKKQGFLLVLGLMGLLLFPFLVYGEEQDVIQNMENGDINWTKQTIQAVGIGAPPEKYYGKPQARPMALRAAKMAAQRNLLEIVQGVRVDSNTVIKNLVVEKDVIETKIKGIIKGAKVIQQQYMSDGTVEVTLELPIHKKPSDKENKDNPISNLFGVVLRDFAQVAFSDTPSQNETPSSYSVSKKTYTGLIVDARGLGVRPALFPRILDENRQEIYSVSLVSPDIAEEKGMVGYAKEIKQAIEHHRVTDNPLTVKALDFKENGCSDIIISNTDASKFKNMPKLMTLLKKCRVMIVLD